MPPTFIPIAKTVLTGTQNNIDFTAIPGTYTDLYLMVSGRSSGAGTSQSIYISCNYATSGYSSTTFRALEGDGQATAATSNTFANQGSIPGSSSTGNTFGSAEFYLPSYAGSGRKPISSTAFNEGNASPITTQARLTAANLNDTNAITTIRVVDTGGGFVSGSSFYLYGIKNS
jgi:hypothetical protein